MQRHQSVLELIARSVDAEMERKVLATRCEIGWSYVARKERLT